METVKLWNVEQGRSGGYKEPRTGELDLVRFLYGWRTENAVCW